MKFIETKLKGAFIVEVEKREDSRGFFGRAWCKNEFEQHGLKTNICQINTSKTLKKGTVRGFHYQVGPHFETKFVRCTRGSIYDVIIDLRPESATFLQWIGVELNETNLKMIYVPENFAQGFLTLENNCEIYYLTTEFYVPKSERGIKYDDPAFNIEWPIEIQFVSKKDMNHAKFIITD